MNALTVITHTSALALVKECKDLCVSVFQYRQLTQRLELERETMNRAADIQLRQIDNQLQSNLAYMDALSDGLDDTFEQLKGCTDNHMILLNKLDQQYDKVLERVTDMSISHEVRAQLLQVLSELTDERTRLLQAVANTGAQAVTAFVQFSDRMDTSPKVYTNVTPRFDLNH